MFEAEGVAELVGQDADELGPTAKLIDIDIMIFAIGDIEPFFIGFPARVVCGVVIIDGQI